MTAAPKLRLLLGGGQRPTAATQTPREALHGAARAYVRALVDGCRIEHARAEFYSAYRVTQDSQGWTLERWEAYLDRSAHDIAVDEVMEKYDHASVSPEFTVERLEAEREAILERMARLTKGDGVKAYTKVHVAWIQFTKLVTQTFPPFEPDDAKDPEFVPSITPRPRRRHSTAGYFYLQGIVGTPSTQTRYPQYETEPAWVNFDKVRQFHYQQRPRYKAKKSVTDAVRYERTKAKRSTPEAKKSNRDAVARTRALQSFARAEAVLMSATVSGEPQQVIQSLTERLRAAHRRVVDLGHALPPFSQVLGGIERLGFEEIAADDEPEEDDLYDPYEPLPEADETEHVTYYDERRARQEAGEEVEPLEEDDEDGGDDNEDDEDL